MIRLVVFGLVAANLLYFGWAALVGGDEPRLVAVTPGARTAPLPPPPPPPCTTIGPFIGASEVLAAQQTLQAMGLEAVAREQVQQVPDGFWVTVEDLPGEAAQRRVLNAIRRAGINDAFAMREDPGFRVSVGVFRDRDRAEDRAALVRRLDIEAGVRERMREATVTWLDAPGASVETLQDGRLATAGLITEPLTIQPCP